VFAYSAAIVLIVLSVVFRDKFKVCLSFHLLLYCTPALFFINLCIYIWLFVIIPPVHCNFPSSSMLILTLPSPPPNLSLFASSIHLARYFHLIKNADSFFSFKTTEKHYYIADPILRLTGAINFTKITFYFFRRRLIDFFLVSPSSIRWTQLGRFFY
jgi:hypothetical protein